MTKKFYLTILLILAFASFNSCISKQLSATRPYLSFLNYEVPNGSPNFQDAYKAGCETVLYARGNGLYRTRYHGHKFNPKMIDNPEYRFGFSRGYSYCFNFIVGGGHFGTISGTGGSSDDYIYGKGTAFDMGTSSINNTVNYGPLDWLIIPDGGLNGSVDVLQKGRGGTVMGSHPFWGTWQKNQFFGLGEDGQ